MTPDDLLAKVVEIVARCSGVDQTKIGRNTRLGEDLGIYGDDGDDILGALEEAFEMDWTGIDAGVIFGNEGFGPPPLWLLRNNCDLFEQQTLTIDQLVEGLKAGRWLHPTPMIPLSGRRRLGVYFGSALVTMLLGGVLFMIVVLLIGWVVVGL